MLFPVQLSLELKVSFCLNSFFCFLLNFFFYFYKTGKLAALWPFLGICAEVFVLCAIILIYEKKRNKQEMEDSDTDQSPEQ